ncbi:MAG: hypothetical protein QOH93_1428, partial [Chloroflexia bacterium]|nr:hypothetical protein [Chloroflexia bacterium]
MASNVTLTTGAPPVIDAAARLGYVHYTVANLERQL